MPAINQKQYVKRAEEIYKDLSKDFPVLWNYIFRKRYILPNYRQGDYSPQAVWDWMMVDSYMSYLMGRMPLDDHVSAHIMNSHNTAFHYGRPIFWLEKELGFPMVRQKLPLDYYTESIHWRWFGFRVYLPKGLLTIRRDGSEDSLAYMDISRVEKGAVLDIPMDLDREFRRHFTGMHGKIPIMQSDLSGMSITGMMDFESSTGPIGYACSCRMEKDTIRDLIEQVGEPIPAPLVSDELDNELQRKMLSLGLTILIFLSALPIEYEVGVEHAIRLPSKEGQRRISGLFPARFIGQSQLRARALAESVAPHGAGYGTGKHIVGHWKCGHWKHQPCGPKSQDRKWIWVNLYKTGTGEPQP